MTQPPLLALVRYEAARKALAEARCVDEVKDIHDEAAAMQEYARRSKDPELIAHATEIRLRARRRLGELMAAQKAAVGLGRPGPKKIGSTADPISLGEAGIDKHLAHRARNDAKKSEEEFECSVAKAKQKQISLVEGARVNRNGCPGDNDWFTPIKYLDLAREVMGDIDLDPASHPIAQKVIRATRFFTKHDDGLIKPWEGRVWLNPPYAQPLIKQFTDKLLASGGVTEAILLTHNCTDTAWFHQAAGAAARICFTRGRIRFEAPDGAVAAPTQGQAFFYFGESPEVFANIFQQIGIICKMGASP
jgi:hypothetical protein